MELNGKKVTVLGGRVTGIQSALFLKKRGAHVFLSEIKNGKEFVEAKKILDQHEIPSEFGQHTWEDIEDSDLIILSPGIPPSAPVYQQATRSQIPVWSEIELAYRFSPSKLIAVTGSNGKTTVTSLIRDVLRASGRKAVSCGNIGNSFVGEVDQLTADAFAVVEVSSFQLSHLDQFKPEVAVLLNLSPNHLDWHPSFEDYVATKYGLFKNQTASDYAVLNSADPNCLKLGERLKSHVIYFDAHSNGNPNFAAVEQVAKLYQIPSQVTETVLSHFTGIEHRFEEAGELFGVRYVNDSKSTTIASLGWALERVGGNAILIAGGRHKGGDFRVLRDLVGRNVKFLVLIGEAKKEIETAFSDLVSCYSASSLAEAVRVARGASKPGDTVLFSPACASFDMFNDYQDRGLQFKAIISSWRDELASQPSR